MSSQDSDQLGELTTNKDQEFFWKCSRNKHSWMKSSFLVETQIDLAVTH